MTKFETFRFLSMDQQIKKRNFRYLNDPSAINITMCVCRTLHALSVEIFVAFIGCFLLILCSKKIFFFCSWVTLLGYVHSRTQKMYEISTRAEQQIKSFASSYYIASENTYLYCRIILLYDDAE